MFDFHEKRKIRGLMYSKYVIGVVLLLAVALSVSVYERFVVEREMAHKRVLKEAELESIELRASMLEAQVEHLENDRGIEEELRSRFDVAKEGEQVVIIVDGEPSESTDLNELGVPPGNQGIETEKRSLIEVLKFW